MYDYMAKDQSMRIPPEGLVNWHPEGEIRNANVLSLIITLYVPSKTAAALKIKTFFVGPVKPNLNRCGI